MGRTGLSVGVGSKPGIGTGGGPVLVKEAIVEGSGKVCNVDFDGVLEKLRGV